MISKKYIPILLAVLAGCSTPEYRQSRIDAQSLETKIKKELKGYFMANQSRYKTVKYSEIMDFADEFSANKLENCEAYMRAFIKSAREKFGSDIAVGEFSYFIDGDFWKGHASVIAFTEKGITLIEPQTGREIYLNRRERECGIASVLR